METVAKIQCHGVTDFVELFWELLNCSTVLPEELALNQKLVFNEWHFAEEGQWEKLELSKQIPPPLEQIGVCTMIRPEGLASI